jgi:hypothetical protein
MQMGRDDDGLPIGFQVSLLHFTILHIHMIITLNFFNFIVRGGVVFLKPSMLFP